MDCVKTVKCPVDEQETIIGWMRGDDRVTISVSDNTTITKLKRLNKRSPGLVNFECISKDTDGNPTEYRVVLPIKCIRFASIRSKGSKVLSDEERKRLGDRMRNGLRQKRS